MSSIRKIPNRVSSALKRVWVKLPTRFFFFLVLVYFYAKSASFSPTSTPAVKVLERELAEEKAERVRLEQECLKAKAEADTFAETKGKLEDEIQKAKDEVQRVNDEVQKVKDGFQKAKTEADTFVEAKGKLEDEIQKLKDQVQKVEELLETRKKEADHKDTTIQQLEKEMQAKAAESRKAVAHAQELSTRLSETNKLLSDRTTELSAAQVFLTKVDAVSEAEVLGIVENLNTLISSASGAISGTWDQREPVPGTLAEEPDMKKIRDDFGTAMIEQIAARNYVAVTLAIEMTLVQFVKQVTSGWGRGDTAGALRKIYGMISTEEGQTIASRWRTLAKRYMPPQEPPRSEEIIDNLARILMITRSFADTSEAMESIGNSAGIEVKAVIGATLQLDDTIKAKIASSDMSVYVVPPGETFIEETMTNVFGEDGTTERGEERSSVAGTMEIGLLQKIGNVEKVLRKPKVVLERDLVEPEGESER